MEEFKGEQQPNQPASSQIMKYLTQYFERSLTKLHRDASGSNAYLFGVPQYFATEFLEKKALFSKELESRQSLHPATAAESSAIMKAFVDKLSDKSQQELKKIFSTILVLRAPMTKWKSPKDVFVNDELAVTLNDLGGYVCDSLSLLYAHHLAKCYQLCHAVPLHFLNLELFPITIATWLHLLSTHYLLWQARNRQNVDRYCCCKFAFIPQVRLPFYFCAYSSDCMAHVSLLPCAELAAHKISYIKERLDTYFLNAVQKQVRHFISLFFDHLLALDLHSG